MKKLKTFRMKFIDFANVLDYIYGEEAKGVRILLDKPHPHREIKVIYPLMSN